jgi:hypothetical protein
VSTINISNPKIKELERQLEAEKAKELDQRKQRLWALVKDLPPDDLRLLGYMIHVHFHGDGEDD